MKENKIEDFFKEKEYLTTAELIKKGISKSSISLLVKKGKLVRVSQGLYTLENEIIDTMYVLHMVYGVAIFSHESALYLHGLIDRNLEKNVMTVYRSYKVKNNDNFDIQFKYVDKLILELGVEYRETDMGNKVPVYNLERTICDIIKNDSKMDASVVNNALREYMTKAKLSKLMIYASKMGIENKVKKKLEVLL